MGSTQMGTPTVMQSRLINYYVYRNMERQTPPDDTPAPSHDDTLKRLEGAGPRWRGEILPEVLRHIQYYRQTDFDALSDSVLAAELDNLRQVRVRQGVLHHLAVLPWMMAMNLLLDTYKELTGGDEVAAVRLVQGYGSKSVEAGQELWNLCRLAASIPAVQQRLLEVTTDKALQTLEELRQLPDASPFLESLSSFLEEYGWRSNLVGFDEPTWVEDPTIPLCQMRQYMDMKDYDPLRELQRLAEEREKAIQETRESLSPEDWARLEEILEIASGYAPILEGHNYYIDQRLATLPRRLVLAVGRRLVSKGVLDRHDDVFYLYANEVRSALHDGKGNFNSLVGDRKEEMAHWARVTPPTVIGPPSSRNPSLDRFFGTHQLRSDQPNVLPGNGASAGLARGPARVLLNLGEAERLKQGDVLVARTTMPPWTPLFAVASALVAETGGILSHAAVTAREYGIPAVLAVKDATNVIRDGQLLEVDGTRGTVRILS